MTTTANHKQWTYVARDMTLFSDHSSGSCSSLPVNTILCGPPGSGKTTFVHRLFHLNADTIRVLNVKTYDFNIDRIIDFSKQLDHRDKIVFIDEADELSELTQNIIASHIEKKSIACIFACNVISKITDRLKQKCIVHMFRPKSVDEIVRIVNDIVRIVNAKEFATLEHRHRRNLVEQTYNMYNHDLRRTLIHLEWMYKTGRLDEGVSECVYTDLYFEHLFKSVTTWKDVLNRASSLEENGVSAILFLQHSIRYHAKLADNNVLNSSSMYGIVLDYMTMLHEIERSFEKRKYPVWFTFVFVISKSPLFRERLPCIIRNQDIA